MNKTLSFCCLVVCVLVSTGCAPKEELPNGSRQGKNSPYISSAPTQVSTTEAGSAGQMSALRISPIDYAQKEYLDSYNDYVRLLRESGPQTIETLQALAVYQKKYQIYQMILKADSKP